MVDFTAFRAEVKKQLTLRGWTYDELSAATGYTKKTIQQCMCKGNRQHVADKIAEVLKIPPYMAT